MIFPAEQNEEFLLVIVTVLKLSLSKIEKVQKVSQRFLKWYRTQCSHILKESIAAKPVFYLPA